MIVATKPFPCDDESASNLMNMLAPVDVILPGKVFPVTVARLGSVTDVPVNIAK